MTGKCENGVEWFAKKNGARKTLCHDITFNWTVVSTHLKNMLVKVGILPE